MANGTDALNCMTVGVPLVEGLMSADVAVCCNVNMHFDSFLPLLTFGSGSCSWSVALPGLSTLKSRVGNPSFAENFCL